MEQEFVRALLSIGQKIKEYIRKDKYTKFLKPKDIFDGSLSYPRNIGKALRPAILTFSCGAVGGDIKKALPAAAAIEMYHTYTLVHDDIIDRSRLRRGKPTVHEHFYNVSKKRGYSVQDAKVYGESVAILVGDIQHSWSLSLLAGLYKARVNPKLVLALIVELESKVAPLLIEGETLDIQYEKSDIRKLTLAKILDMSAKKTGELYMFAARAGAMIGKNTSEARDSVINSIAKFCFNAGIAFQLQDDILDLIPTSKKFGKEVGGDIREGKRTAIVWYSYKNANSNQRKEILRALGNGSLSKKEVKSVISLFKGLGGIEETRKLASSYIYKAKKCLKNVPESKYKKLLSSWADFMIERSV